MASPVPSEAQNLCARCQMIDFDEIFSREIPEWAPYDSERVLDLGSAQDLANGCALCTLFAAMWNTDNNTASCNLNLIRIKNVLISPWRTRSFYQHGRIEGGDTILLFPATDLYSRGWTFQKGYLSSILPPGPGPNIGFRMISPATFDFHFVSDSISYCSVNHGSSCRQQLNDTPNFFKVVDCKARQVIVAQPGCQYLALSYVWGSTTSTPDRSLLDLDNCPKVINDSIDVTLKLMFQYLWVDRYCIDQLDETDKHHQIRQMGSIYANAKATIIAAAGDGPGYGLPGVNGTLRKQQPHLRIHDHLLASTLPHPSWSVKNSKWASRGWTYQENILSKRRIIFTDEQVLFECNSMHYAESQILPLDVLHTEDKTMFKSHVAEGAFKWKTPRSDPEDIIHFLADFSKRELSYPADAINAMQGIFQMFSKTEYPVYHIEGVPILWATLDTVVPVHSFIRGLSWCHPIPGKRRPEFPSWSWAGWTGQLQDWFMCRDKCPVGTILRLETEDGIIEKAPKWDHWLEFLSKRTTNNVKILHIQGWTLRCTIVHLKSGKGETGRDTDRSCVPEDGYFLKFKLRKNKAVYLTPKWDLDVSHLDGKSLKCIFLSSPTNERLFASLPMLVVNQNMDGLSERVGCCSLSYGSVYVQVDQKWVDPWKSPQHWKKYFWDTPYWNMLKKKLERRTIRLG